MDEALLARIVADHRNAEMWKNHREGKIGASDAAKFAKEESVDSYVASKLAPAWDGSAYSEWGNEREPVILLDHGYEQNHFMFRSVDESRFVATPDGIKADRLCQVKTTVKDFRSKRTGDIMVPPNYRRQCWWEQYVMGYDLTDFIYEKHEKINDQFVPEFEATVVVIERDDAEIEKLVRIARKVLRGLDLSAF